MLHPHTPKKTLMHQHKESQTVVTAKFLRHKTLRIKTTCISMPPRAPRRHGFRNGVIHLLHKDCHSSRCFCWSGVGLVPLQGSFIQPVGTCTCAGKPLGADANDPHPAYSAYLMPSQMPLFAAWSLRGCAARLIALFLFFLLCVLQAPKQAILGRLWQSPKQLAYS